MDGPAWDPDGLVDLFVSVGAYDITPVALYHDNFDNLDSRFQPWNSVNVGPRRDVLGDWRRACTARGIRLGASDHASRAWQWMAPAHLADTTGPLAGVAYDGRLKNPPSTQAVVSDTEKGRFADLKDFVWQCDTTLDHDWFYIQGQALRLSAAQVVATLIDIVSKNGNLMLNVGLRPDGTLPDDQREALEEIGTWLAVNGEPVPRPRRSGGRSAPTRLPADGLDLADHARRRTQPHRFP